MQKAIPGRGHRVGTGPGQKQGGRGQRRLAGPQMECRLHPRGSAGSQQGGGHCSGDRESSYGRSRAEARGHSPCPGGGMGTRSHCRNLGHLDPLLSRSSLGSSWGPGGDMCSGDQADDVYPALKPCPRPQRGPLEGWPLAWMLCIVVTIWWPRKLVWGACRAGGELPPGVGPEQAPGWQGQIWPKPHQPWCDARVGAGWEASCRDRAGHGVPWPHCPRPASRRKRVSGPPGPCHTPLSALAPQDAAWGCPRSGALLVRGRHSPVREGVRFGDKWWGRGWGGSLTRK